MAGNLIDYSDNVGLGDGLVPSDNKPLPGPVVTKIYRRQVTSLRESELTPSQLRNISLCKCLLPGNIFFALWAFKIWIVLLLFCYIITWAHVE